MSGIIKREQSMPVVTQQVSPMQLIQVALDSGADIDKLERLMVMEERWNARMAQQAFVESMARLQAELPEIKKLKKGHGYMYAPISDIVAQTREFIASHGFSYRFEQSQDAGAITVTCIVTHSAGHSERTSLSSGSDTSGSKNAVQAIASAVTYLQRYTLCGAFGIVTADQDSDARLAGQAQQEFATSAQVIQIYELLESTGTTEDRAKQRIVRSLGWPIDAVFDFCQIPRQVAADLISSLKKKAAQNAGN